MEREIEQPHWKRGPLVALAGAALLAVGLFLIIPLTQLLESSAPPDVTFREMVILQPPAPEAPPPPANEPPPEETTPPEFEHSFQELTLNQLELSLEPGIGDALSMGVRTMGEFASDVDVMANIEEVFTFEDLPDAPRLLGLPRVNYPEALARKGVRKGTVVLLVLIDEKGNVRVEDVLSSTHPDLEPEAVNVARRSRFTAPEIDGRPVKVRGEWPLTLQAP